jgi:hypothetical protein
MSGYRTNGDPSALKHDSAKSAAYPDNADERSVARGGRDNGNLGPRSARTASLTAARPNPTSSV